MDFKIYVPSQGRPLELDHEAHGTTWIWQLPRERTPTLGSVQAQLDFKPRFFLYVLSIDYYIVNE